MGFGMWIQSTEMVRFTSHPTRLSRLGWGACCTTGSVRLCFCLAESRWPKLFLNSHPMMPLHQLDKPNPILNCCRRVGASQALWQTLSLFSHWAVNIDAKAPKSSYGFTATMHPNGDAIGFDMSFWVRLFADSKRCPDALDFDHRGNPIFRLTSLTDCIKRFSPQQKKSCSSQVSSTTIGLLGS